jgi:GntR family transcriptional repressor for pyruvate dehydrogenase complex
MSRPYERRIAFVEAELAAGRLRLGDRLPAERNLASDRQMSRASVREGLRVLEAMGIVRASAGHGPASGGVVVAETSAALAGALRLHVAAAALPIADGLCATPSAPT